MINRLSNKLDYSSKNNTIVPYLSFTNHANKRMQQRGIRKAWIDLVLEYGRETYQNGKHTSSFSLDNSSVKQIKKTYGDISELSKIRKLYLILSDDDVVITCAYR